MEQKLYQIIADEASTRIDLWNVDYYNDGKSLVNYDEVITTTVFELFGIKEVEDKYIDLIADLIDEKAVIEAIEQAADSDNDNFKYFNKER